MLKGISRNVFLLGIVSLLTDLSSQMVFPLIPLFMTTVLAAPAYAIGLVEGAAESMAALLKVVSGYWSDRLGRRKPFILLGYGLAGFTKPLFAFAASWPMVLLIRAVERVGKGIRNAPRDAMVAESTDDANLGKSFGFQRALDGLGSVLGTLLAVALISTLPGSPEGVYQTAFLLSVVPAIVATLAILKLREGAPKRLRPPEAMRLSWKALPGNLKLFTIVSSLFAFGHVGYAFLLLKAKDIGLSDPEALLLYASFYLTYTIVSTPFGAWSDRIGRKRFLLIGYGVFALLSAGLIFAESLTAVAAAFIVYGLFFAIIDGGQKAFVAELAPDHLKATALGAFHSSIGLFAMPGGFVAGLLWERIGPEATFLFAAALSTLAFVLLTFIRQRDVRSP